MKTLIGLILVVFGAIGVFSLVVGFIQPSSFGGWIITFILGGFAISLYIMILQAILIGIEKF